VAENNASASNGGGFIGAFIQRPILAAVLSLLIVIAGLAAFFGVEVRELPDVDRPVVSIDASYPGATPETVDAEVTAIIESAVAQISPQRTCKTPFPAHPTSCPKK